MNRTYLLEYKDAQGTLKVKQFTASDVKDAVATVPSLLKEGNILPFRVLRAKWCIDYDAYNDAMGPSHDSDACHAALAYRMGYDSIDFYARKYETSYKAISAHSSCANVFWEKVKEDYYPVYLSDEGLPLSDQESKAVIAIERNKRQEKMAELEQEDYENEEYEDYEDEDQEEAVNDSDRYAKYGGYNDYSDDEIDEAFEGDPEATWNVD